MGSLLPFCQHKLQKLLSLELALLKHDVLSRIFLSWRGCLYILLLLPKDRSLLYVCVLVHWFLLCLYYFFSSTHLGIICCSPFILQPTLIWHPTVLLHWRCWSWWLCCFLIQWTLVWTHIILALKSICTIPTLDTLFLAFMPSHSPISCLTVLSSFSFSGPPSTWLLNTEMAQAWSFCVHPRDCKLRFLRGPDRKCKWRM